MNNIISQFYDSSAEVNPSVVRPEVFEVPTNGSIEFDRIPVRLVDNIIQYKFFFSLANGKKSSCDINLVRMDDTYIMNEINIMGDVIKYRFDGVIHGEDFVMTLSNNSDWIITSKYLKTYQF